MGLSGVEPLTSRLSGARSNQLSYRPNQHIHNAAPSAPKIIYKNSHAIIQMRTLSNFVDLSVGQITERFVLTVLLRKEVIQPQLPLRLPCYDLAPVIGFTLGAAFLAVRQTTSGAPNFRGLTGGVYKARERIHRCLLISDY